jgi:hypothetical protein
MVSAIAAADTYAAADLVINIATCGALGLRYGGAKPGEGGFKSLIIDIGQSREDLSARFHRVCKAGGVDPARASQRVAIIGRGDLDSPIQTRRGQINRPVLQELFALARGREVALVALGLLEKPCREARDLLGDLACRYDVAILTHQQPSLFGETAPEITNHIIRERMFENLD